MVPALPDLQQLAWRHVQCSDKQQLPKGALLQHLTRLTGLDLLGDIQAAALQHLASLTKLHSRWWQHLMSVLQAWECSR